jgi:hypothetical protein
LYASAPPPGPDSPWPNIAALFAQAGHITIGNIGHVKAAAVAADEHTVLVTLVRRDGESIQFFLERLESAIGRALHEGMCTNEIPGGHFELAGRKGRGKKNSLRS